jgi:hypothetical protein
MELDATTISRELPLSGGPADSCVQGEVDAEDEDGDDTDYRLHLAEQKVCAAVLEVDSFRIAMKAAKKRYDKAVNELRALNEGGPRQTRLIPEDKTPLPFGSDWQNVPLSALVQHGMPDGAGALLVDAGVETLGQLANWSSSEPPRQIRGIGTGKRRKIGDAWLAFWQTHPEYCRPKPESAADSPLVADSSQLAA